MNQLAYVADADASFCRKLSAALEMTGVAVRSCGNLVKLDRLLATDLPDLVILSFAVAGPSWIEVLRALQQRIPTARIVMESQHNPDASTVVSALRNGVDSVFHHASSIQQVVDLVTTSRNNSLAHLQSLASVAHKLQTLTPREREVLQKLLAGRSNKEVAQELQISHRTVEVHRAQCMRKLGARNSFDLARRLQE
jgi:RNA polymerase sigma factor (sigma-70 family)